MTTFKLKDKFITKAFEEILGKENVLSSLSEISSYSYDASLTKALPSMVLFPRNAEEISKTVKTCRNLGVPFVARGAGTNLSGGSIPLKNALIINLLKLNNILCIDEEKRTATVEPGVINGDLQKALSTRGFFYPPDPASQNVSTIGGNVAENAGGPRCLKYGVTSNFVERIEVVLPDGTISEFGDTYGNYDIKGLLTGSEGTLGIITKITVKFLPLPEYTSTVLSVFSSIEDAVTAVTGIIAEGIVPDTLEAFDKPMINAIKSCRNVDYPENADAILLLDVSGTKQDVEDQIDHLKIVLTHNKSTEIRVAESKQERDKLWEGRRSALSSASKILPTVFVEDGTVPRTNLTSAMRKVAEIAKKYGLIIGNVFHAGDGNLHPLIIFDERDKNQKEKILSAGIEILKECVNLGGTISGEHGIGIDKIPAMKFLFSEDTLGLMRNIKSYFDPLNLCNPGKILPDAEEIAIPEKLPGVVVETNRQSYAPSSIDELSAILSSINPLFIPLFHSCQNDTRGKEGDFNFPLYRYNDMSVSLINIIGGETKIKHENIAPCINTTGLKGIIDYDKSNFTIEVLAGTTLAEIKNELQNNGQFLPIDVPAEEKSTIGGTISAGFRAIRNYFYPSIKDSVLGIKTVLSDGRIISYGGKNVKNVAGYNLASIFCGSFGTLGVIASVTIKLLPLPIMKTHITADFGSIKTAADCFLSIRKEKLTPSYSVLTRQDNRIKFDVGFEDYPVKVKQSVERVSGIIEKNRVNYTIGNPENYDSHLKEIVSFGHPCFRRTFRKKICLYDYANPEKPEISRSGQPCLNSKFQITNKFHTDFDIINELEYLNPQMNYLIDLNNSILYINAPVSSLSSEINFPCEKTWEINIDYASKFNRDIKKLFDRKMILNPFSISSPLKGEDASS